MPTNTDNVLTSLLLGNPSTTGSFNLPTEWDPGTLVESNAGQPLFQDAAGYFIPSVQPKVDIQMFTANGTWRRPTFGNWTLVFLFGGGGAGGSPNTTGGANGGGPGGCVWAWSIPTALLPSTVLVTVGAGGTATSGQNGGSGGTSIFGNIATLGAATPPSNQPQNYNMVYAYASGGTGGNRPGGSSGQTWGGTGNVIGAIGATSRLTNIPLQSARLFGPSGGGFGGSTSTKSTNRAGSAGGTCGIVGSSRSVGNMTGGTAGTNPGGAGGVGSSASFDAGYWRGGSGGGGAAAASSGPGANGGAGGFPGGGGGGGSSGTTGVHGTGGAGGAGLVYVYTW